MSDALRTHPLRGARQGRLRGISGALGGAVLAGGLITLAGWAGDLPGLTDWFGAGIAMQPNTALAAACAGAALLLLAFGRPGPAPWLGGLVAVIGGATFFQHLSGLNLGIDTLLFDKPWGRTATVAPGRMGPPASLTYTVAGIGLICASLRTARLRSAAPVLGILSLCIPLPALLGYLFGAGELYALPHLTAIAVQTSLLLAAIGAGLIAAIPDREPVRTLLSDGAAGLLARRALPVILVLPVLLAWLRVIGQRRGLYDTAMGVAFLVLSLTLLMTAVLWWGVRAVAARERERRVAEEALRRRTAQFETLLGAAPLGIYVVDSDLRIVHVNPTALPVFGDIPGLIGRDIGEVLRTLWPRAHAEELLARFRRTLETGQPYVDPEWAEQRLDRGGVEFYEWRIDRIPLPEDRHGVVCYFRDISSQVQARLEIARSEEALREADRRKDAFLATLSHELRNPLAVVRNALALLNHAGGSVETADRARAMMSRQVMQLVRLVDDLLDVSRIARDKVTLRRRREDLVALLRQAIDVCLPTVREMGHTLTTDFPPEPVPLMADDVRLAQAFGNLLSNACKYTPPGGRVDVAIERAHGEVAVRIRDSGVGIREEMLPRVFDMFSQDRSLEQSQAGLGIGLALARRLVEMHDGTITVHSDGEGRGSEFVVRLPVLAASTEAPEPGHPAQGPPSPPPRRILVVDDSRDNAESLAALLSLEGHEVVQAHDGDDALGKIASLRPDAILLDLGMPGLNGYETCRRIRQLPGGHEILVLALTGWGQQEHLRRSADAGFDAHLVKPVEPDDLLRLLQEADGRSARAG